MWKITKDNIAEPDEESRVGYSEEHTRIPVSMAAIGFQSQPLPSKQVVGSDVLGTRRVAELPMIKFRLRDEDNEVHYQGVLHDDSDCENQEAALMFGVDDTGACIIEVRRNGKWVQEIG